MAIKVYIPRETTASSLGAEALVDAIKTEALYRNLDIEIVRNGSRGACFLEPLVEVITAAGKRASAFFKRFCTSICANDGLVPG